MLTTLSLLSSLLALFSFCLETAADTPVLWLTVITYWFKKFSLSFTLQAFPSFLAQIVSSVYLRFSNFQFAKQ